MREYLFRGKRIDNGEWIYGYIEFHLIDGDLTKTKKKAFITYESMDDIGKVYRYESEVILETVGQYTGFRDRNNKKVFEGDIVIAWSQGYCGKFEIKWREDGGGSPMWLLYPAWQNREMWSISASRESDGQVYDNGLEVIGNIYDNLNLLKEDNHDTSDT